MMKVDQHGLPFWEWVARRLVHMSSALFLIYFYVPHTVITVRGVRVIKPVVLILLYLLIPVNLELWRLTVHKGKTFFMLRSYEEGRVAAYFWTVTGAVLLCLTTEVGFPQFIAAPTILVSSFGDPTLGLARGKRLRRRYIYTLGWAVCTAIFLIFRYWWPMAVIAGFISVLAESLELEITWGFREDLMRDFERKSRPFREIKKLRLSDRILRTDDNFVMMVIPYLILTIIWLILTAMGISGWFPEDIFIQEYPHPLIQWP